MRTRYVQHVHMTYPRRLLVPPDSAGTYHVVTRCVRRAFLCGEDRETGRSFAHRRDWIEQRLHVLAKAFAVDVYAYAVMSNHLHLVVHIDPAASRRWSDEDITRRWLRVFPKSADDTRESTDAAAVLRSNPQRISTLRSRLGSLSWFMRCLKEPIARRANREDGCTGRFWEGRFKVQAILDEPALLSTMVYVDLNPFRSGRASKPLTATHTSISHHRRTDCNEQIGPVVGSLGSELIEATRSDYRSLVLLTASSLAQGQAAAKGLSASVLLTRAGIEPRRWTAQVLATESRYYRAVGTASSLADAAERLALRWIRGIRFARRLESLRSEASAAVS